MLNLQRSRLDLMMRMKKKVDGIIVSHSGWLMKQVHGELQKEV